MDEHWYFAPAWRQVEAVKAREISPRELVRGHVERIERLNGGLNAYVALRAQEAVDRAGAVERAVLGGAEVGPLAGLPIALKDLLDLHSGMPNTCGSVPLARYRPRLTTEHVVRLEAAGGIVAGKTNTAEFGHQAVTDNNLFGPTSTPFNPAMNAGGSSGGSAAAVAGGLAAVALGSDGGGSVRIPAAFCGVFGFKPTFGRLPQSIRPNAFAPAAPFVQQGTLTRTVRDAALVLEVLMRPSTRDPWSQGPGAGRLQGRCARPAPSGRVAFSADLGAFPVTSQVREAVSKAAVRLTELGVAVDSVDAVLAEDQQEMSAAWRRLTAVANAERLDWLAREGMDLLADDGAALTPTYAELLREGLALGAVDYLRAGRVRTRVFEDLQRVFDDFDYLVTPTLAVPHVPNAHDGVTTGPASVNGRATDRLIGWCLTYPVNFTGHPAASLPVGRGPAGVPVGMQVIARRGEDERLLELCAAFEAAHPWTGWYQSLTLVG